jgi:[acyl-carrier-protein] S-malonyltransferase
MGKIAFVFPGQGSQAVGMGKAVHDAVPAARAVFEAADAALGESLSQLCFEGPVEQLKLTANTQPALLTTAIALLRALDEKPDAVAGHSLGEWCGELATGVIADGDVDRLLAGLAPGPVGEGAMAAVLGGDPVAIEQALRAVPGVVEPVNYNSPGQIVIAGQASAVEAVKPALIALGCKVMPIPVSAPFHSSLMQPAEERLRPHLTDTPFERPEVPVYVNVDAVPVSEGALLRDALVRQVSRPVRWQESVKRMREDGVTLCVEIGPGKVLAGLIKRIDGSIKSVNVQTPDDFEAARAAIRAAREVQA